MLSCMPSLMACLAHRSAIGALSIISLAMDSDFSSAALFEPLCGTTWFTIPANNHIIFNKEKKWLSHWFSVTAEHKVSSSVPRLVDVLVVSV